MTLNLSNTDDLIALFAHDLKGPLGNIRNFADLATHVGPLNETQLKYLQRVDSNVARALLIIENLLRLQELGHENLHPEAMPLLPMIERALELIETPILARGIVVTVDIAPDATTLYCDPHWFEHVMYNLLFNAVKYNKPAGNVVVTAARDADSTILVVTDEGIGIPENALAHVFDKFYRAKGGGKDGSGLGLSIVREIVQRHGGEVHVESVTGEGTVFTVRLPLAAAAARFSDGDEGETTS